MNVKQGLKYVAVGFLFTLININLIVNGVYISITPDFIGWILLFLAFDKLGTYISDKQYLKWISLLLAIFSAVTWILSIASPELNVDILKNIISVASTVYIFMLFTVLEKIAHDFGSDKENTLHILKYVNVALYIAFVITALIAAYSGSDTLAIPALISGLACLVSAIFTAVTLFKLSKEISEK